MELVEIARNAVNETDKMRIRGAVDITVPLVDVSRDYPQALACPSPINREGPAPVSPSPKDSIPRLELP
jgi:hypothetical protein